MTIDRGLVFLAISSSFYKRKEDKEMEDEELRKRVKLCKAEYGITYKQIADELDIKQRSMYNWLAGQFDFSSRRKRKLYCYLMQKKGE